jgi:hypothetical protein
LPNSYLFLLLSLFFMHFRILRFSFSLIRLLTFLSLNVLNLVAEHRGLSPRYQFLLLSPHYAIMTYAVLLRKLGWLFLFFLSVLGNISDDKTLLNESTLKEHRRLLSATFKETVNPTKRVS